jgi:hypothetical protein
MIENLLVGASAAYFMEMSSHHRKRYLLADNDFAAEILACNP